MGRSIRPGHLETERQIIRIDQAQPIPIQRWTQYVATQPLQTQTIRRLYTRGDVSTLLSSGKLFVEICEI